MSLKIQELSIGNYIEADRSICIINNLYADGRVTLTPDISSSLTMNEDTFIRRVPELEPVSINGTVLNELGFIKSSIDNMYYISNDDKLECRIDPRDISSNTETIVTFWYFEVASYYKTSKKMEYVIVGNDIKYVHTLQNLYMSLFNKKIGITQ